MMMTPDTVKAISELVFGTNYLNKKTFKDTLITEKPQLNTMQYKHISHNTKTTLFPSPLTTVSQETRYT